MEKEINKVNVVTKLHNGFDVLRDKISEHALGLASAVGMGTAYAADIKFLIVDGVTKLNTGLGKATEYLTTQLTQGNQTFTSLVSGTFGGVSISSLGQSMKQIASETVHTVFGNIGGYYSFKGNTASYTLAHTLPGISQANLGYNMQVTGVLLLIPISVAGIGIYVRSKL